MKNYFPLSKTAMNLKFDIRFKYISRILIFQLIGYLETSSNNPLMCLKSEGHLILQRLVVNFDLYIDSNISTD